MWWLGWAAYSKTSWESCPAYGMRTYMDGESTEVTDTVKSSSCIQIIEYNLQNPRNMISTYGLLSGLGLDQLQHPYRLIDLLWRTIATSHSTNRTCAHLDLQLQNNSTSSPLKKYAQKAHAYRSRDMHYLLNETIWIHQAPFWPLHTDTFRYQYKLWKMNLASFSCSPHLTYITMISSMDATHYWPFAREYSIWNTTTVTALQF